MTDQDLAKINDKLDSLMILLKGDEFGNAGMVERIRTVENEIKTIKGFKIQEALIQIDANREMNERLVRTDEQRQFLMKGIGIGLALNLAGLGAVLTQIFNLF